MTDAISTTDLGRSYGATVALHPLTMTVAKGKVFGFFGHNGAGKTTTIQLLTTLARPTTGRASVAGHDILTDAMAVRRSIGYVPENVALYDTFTTRENLMFFARLSAVDHPSDRVAETIDFLGIADLAARRVGEFSKGMRQRVGLAQAILHRPEVLFLDEPTSGLDPMGVKLLRRVIERLNADGMTIFMNTHLLGEVARTCTSIGILSHRQLVFQDRIDAVSNLYGDDNALEALYLSVLPETGRAA